MAVPSLELHRESQTDLHPLLMERTIDQNSQDHSIDFTWDNVGSSSDSHSDLPSNTEVLSQERAPSSRTRALTRPSSSASRNSSFRRRGDRYGRRHRSPLNSGLWISIELTIIVSQIIASIIVLALSRGEKPQAPLFAWVVGYAAGCVATLPHLYWRYIHRNNYGTEQESTHRQMGSAQSTPPLESTSYTVISVPQAQEEEQRPNTTATSWNGQNTTSPSPRLTMLVDHLKMALDCFFAVWFVVGNVWIFGGHSSASDAPNLYRKMGKTQIPLKMVLVMGIIVCQEAGTVGKLMARAFQKYPFVGELWILYMKIGSASLSFMSHCLRKRLCIVFLTFSCIGYAMPFILCATICCCLPCIISILGFREDHPQTRGATPESICALPTYKFKLKGNGDREESEINAEGLGDCGVIGAGTDKERTISAEDAVCCICLAKYADEEELRELPCSHFFHVECVDKWLKINALCPLCKHEVGESAPTESNPNRRQGERRVGTDPTRDIYAGPMF